MTLRCCAERLKNNTVWNANKHSNEAIYYNIDEIERAITAHKKLSFQYFDYDAKKNRVFRKQGKRYSLTPLGTMFSSDNYYLIGYDDKHRSQVRYRVDRMTKVEILEEDGVEPDAENRFDPIRYRKEIFGMYGGERKRVVIEADKKLISPILDKFGEDVGLAEWKNGKIRFEVDVQVSGVFFGWCCAFGNQLKIIAPESVAEQFRRHVSEILRHQEGK